MVKGTNLTESIKMKLPRLLIIPRNMISSLYKILLISGTLSARRNQEVPLNVTSLSVISVRWRWRLLSFPRIGPRFEDKANYYYQRPLGNQTLKCKLITHELSI